MDGCDHDYALPESDRARLDELTATLPGTVVYRLVTTPEGARDLVYVSPNIDRLFGIKAGSVMRDAGAWYSLLHPDDVNRVLTEQARAISAREPFHTEARYVLADGRERVFDLHSSPTQQPDGCVLWNGAATDVSERAAARRDRQRLVDLVEATPDVVGIVTAEGDVEYLNAGGRRLLGLPPDGPVDREVTSFHPPGATRKHIEEIIETIARGEVWTGETTLVTADGSHMPVSQIVTATPHADGTVTHYATIMRDLRPQRAAAEALVEANEQVQVALREVNHRIKNFFALVPSLVQLSARTATDATGLATAITDRIGALSRSHALTLNAFSSDHGVSLDALIRAVLEPYQDAADAFSFNGPSVRLSGRIGNAVALALHELATNAAKHGVFSTPGGRVTISWTAPRTDGTRPLTMVWQEDGGPPVEGPPTHLGFGTSLLDRLIAAQGGTVEREWRRAGVRVRIGLPRT